MSDQESKDKHRFTRKRTVDKLLGIKTVDALDSFVGDFTPEEQKLAEAALIRATAPLRAEDFKGIDPNVTTNVVRRTLKELRRRKEPTGEIKPLVDLSVERTRRQTPPTT
jgi:hypothetical protein